MRKHMKIIKIIVGLVLFCALFPTLQAVAQEEGQPYFVTSQDGATMTASADINGMVVAQLQQGSRVKFILQQDNLVKIDFNGRLGWVSSELIAPFTKELLPIYSSYYKLLQNSQHIVYALVADFTQDGVEDLYVVIDSNPAKGQYEEKIYSGDKIVYQKSRTTGLTVLKNATGYHLWHHSQTNSDKKYKLSKLNEQAKTDYFEVSGGKGTYEITANTYLKSYFIVSPGNSINEQTLVREQIASKDYYGADKRNEYEESIYLESFSLSKDGKTQSLLERDFSEFFSHYEKSKIEKVIYEDDYKSASLSDRFSFDIERVKKELLDLAEAVMPNQKLNSTDEENDELKVKLTQSVLLEMPYSEAISRNSFNYFKTVEQAIQKGLVGYDSSTLDRTTTDSENTYKREAMNAIIYDFYGAKVNDEEFNRLANNEGYVVDEEKYYAPIMETQSPETYIYRQLQAIELLANQYVAIKFKDYEMPQSVKVSEMNESAIIAGTEQKSGYVLFKQLLFKSGVKWVYIDTVEQLDYLNTDQYATYENSLDIIQKFIAEQQAQQVEEPEAVNEIIAPENQQIPTEPNEKSNTLILFVAFGMLIASSVVMYRKKISKK